MEKVLEGIAKFELTPNRMHIEEIKNNITLINDSYNASYESMKSALEVLSNVPSIKKIAVLGDMFELRRIFQRTARKSRRRGF